MTLRRSGKVSGRQKDAPSIAKRSPILIVDDDEDNLLLLSYALEDMGYSTIQGSCGSDAIDLAAEHSPALIFLDVLLPDMNGMTVVRHLRRYSATRYTPIVAVTALARDVERKKIIASGFTAYIAKPYMLDELYRIAKRYMR
ncbi:MAG: response regulator [Leptolyngbyaceae cyanobacterium]